MMGMFTKATKDNLYLRMSLSGVAGSGKTWTALTIAQTLARGRPIAVLDTEYGSARKYADRFAFDVLELSSFHPDRYVEAIKAAADEGYAVIVLDSLTHAWKGKDGILELVAAIEKRKFNGGKNIAAWADVKPIETRLVEAIIRTPIHIIATMRTTADYVTEENAQGRKVMRKVGLKSEQREGFDYEFDVAAMMTDANEMIVQKSRCPDLSGAVISKPGADVAEILRAWLSSAPETRQTQAQAQPPMPAPASHDEAQAADASDTQLADKNDQLELAEWLRDANFGSVGAVARFLAETLGHSRVKVAALKQGHAEITTDEVGNVIAALAARREALAAGESESDETNGNNFEDLAVLNQGPRP